MFVARASRYSNSITRHYLKCSTPYYFQFKSNLFNQSRAFCNPTIIPKVEESEITDKARSVADRILKLDFIALCQFLDQIQSKTGIDPNKLANAASGGAAGGAGEATKQVADTGFRKISIREFTGGNLPVKEKFSIMKLMRAEQPDLSLADCKQRLDKAPCVIFDKIDKEKAENIVDQLKTMAIVLISEPV